MGAFHHLVQAVVGIVILYGLALLLRWQGVLTEDHSVVLVRLVTDLFLPATIFVSLAGRSIQLRQLESPLVMLGLELAAVALAWAVSARLRFPKAQQGAIVFCSAFGSSAFLGYALINEMYPNNSEAMGEAVLVSEIGVGYAIFILGPVLAAYFGSRKSEGGSPWSASLAFFRSPVFFSLLVGLLWAILRLPGEDNPFLSPVFQVCRVLAAALTPVAVLAVGLMFKLPTVRGILLPLAIVVAIKLLLEPLGASIFATIGGFPDLWHDVLVLLAAMPPAVLGVVFLHRYGADSALASALLLAATIISCGTLLIVFSLAG
jgi:predicted permease